jgi:hypothetical protein
MEGSQIKKRFSEEQIIRILREAEQEERRGDVLRRTSQPTHQPGPLRNANQLFLDCGANFGYYSGQPKGHVIT